MTEAERPPAGPGGERRAEVERGIAELWAGLLGRPDIDRSADFFALGGDSLLATRMVARLRKKLGVRVPVRLVFDTPTLAAYTARIIELASASGGDGDRS